MMKSKFRKNLEWKGARVYGFEIVDDTGHSVFVR